MNFHDLMNFNVTQNLSILIDEICRLKPGDFGSEMISNTEFLKQIYNFVWSLYKTMFRYRNRLNILTSLLKSFK